MRKIRYFNFPISLLKDFMIDDYECLDNILAYTLYVQTLEYEYGDEVEQIKSVEKFFNVKYSNKQELFNKGEILYDSLPPRTPKVGINTTILFDYYKNDKTEFQKICLLGFLAIKSILQNKPYCKITNNFWLSRMSGFSKSVSDPSKLPKSILKYSNEYQTKKIKQELILEWYLVYFARYTRGFYVSFKLDLNQLTLEAEKRRRATQVKQLKIAQDEALKLAMKKLNE